MSGEEGVLLGQTVLSCYGDVWTAWCTRIEPHHTAGLHYEYRQFQWNFSEKCIFVFLTSDFFFFLLPRMQYWSNSDTGWMWHWQMCCAYQFKTDWLHCIKGASTNMHTQISTVMLIISFFACVYHSITCLMFDVTMTSVRGALVQQCFLSLPRDDDDLRAKLCCNTMGRGQRTHSPTVPVSQLSETRGATTEWQVRSVERHASRASGGRTRASQYKLCRLRDCLVRLH